MNLYVKTVKCHHQLTLKAERSISSRLRAGESLAMMEDTNKALSVATISSNGLYCHECVFSSLLLSLYCPTFWWAKYQESPYFQSAARRASVQGRSARAHMGWPRAPWAVAPSGSCLRDVESTEEDEAPWTAERCRLWCWTCCSDSQERGREGKRIASTNHAHYWAGFGEAAGQTNFVLPANLG